MKEQIKFQVVGALFMIGFSQAVFSAYPKIAETRDSEQLSLLDETLPYRKGTSLFEIRNIEMNAMINSAQLKTANATAEDISRAGIPAAGMPGQSAKDLYKERVFEKAVQDRNLELIKKMNSLPVPQTPDPGKVATLSHHQIMSTAASIETSPATDSRDSLKSKYDPDGEIGYCFLRAHYYAGSVEQRGLDMKSVKKVFLVGSMNLFGSSKGGWRYHVATAVRGDDGKWYVLDNHLGKDRGGGAYARKAYTVEDWYKYYEKYLNVREDHAKDSPYDGGHESIQARALYFYVTDADRMAAEPDTYNKEHYYGVDKNKNGKIDRNEVFFAGAFRDVDTFLAVPIHLCSSERYAPLDADSYDCKNMTAADQQALQDRKNLIRKWKLEASFEAEQKINPTYGIGAR